MKISDIMTRNVQVADPQQSIREAAATMARIDSGALLVGEGDRLVGMITDRDIAIRAVAGGLSGDTPLGRIMSGAGTHRRHRAADRLGDLRHRPALRPWQRRRHASGNHPRP